MPYANNAWIIFEGLRNAIEAGVDSVEVVSRWGSFEADAESRAKKYLATYGRAVVVVLGFDEQIDRANASVVTGYQFSLYCVVSAGDTTQREIMDLTEEVKHILYQNTSNPPIWEALSISDSEYFAPPEQTNYQYSQISLRVTKNVDTSAS